jgi:DNA polymerase-3 subunit epsilon
MRSERLAFVDLETTGANFANDRIIEIGIVEVAGMARFREWSSLVNPGRPVPPFITGLTGIDTDMVASAPRFEDLAAAAAGTSERPFVRRPQRALSITASSSTNSSVSASISGQPACVQSSCRASSFPDTIRHSLDTLVGRYDIVVADRHRALADADLIWQFWRKATAASDPEQFEAALRQQLQRPSLPPHLDADVLDDLPEGPGVYLFHGENDVLLYVGKSINLRKRVLSHFAADTRNDKEMRLAQQVRRIDWRETAGELGALLLESRLVKTAQPLHNRQLKRAGELCGWRLQEVAPGDYRPQLITGEEAASDIGNLYGMFASRREALNTLRKIVQAHQLCPQVLGLEAAQPGRACFAHQVQQCKGACVGKEPPSLHSARLMSALAKLKLKAWPYAGPVGLIERDEFLDREEMHLIDHWRYLGTAANEAEAYDLLAQAPPPFDRDIYKLLQTHLRKGKLQLRRF